MYAEKNVTEEEIPIRTIYIPNISINVSIHEKFMCHQDLPHDYLQSKM